MNDDTNTNGNGNGNGNGRKPLPQAGPDPVADLAPATGFPASEKIYVEADGPGGAVKVPFRRIHLSGGEPPLDVYDTQGPLDGDLHRGLPKLRAAWIAARLADGDDGNRTQMHYARRGVI